VALVARDLLNAFPVDPYLTSYLFLWLCTILSFIYSRVHFRSRAVFHALTVANVLLTLSPGCMVILLLMGGSNVAQLSGNMAGWQFWLNVFPILGLGAFAALFVTIVASIYHVVVNLIRKRRREVGVFVCYAVPTLLLSLVTLYGLGQFAPDA